ncbi:trypsin-like peptidase domain-containing protein [Aquabacter sp. L1I39]|uniref:S1 family peptidase n=1 Tax=Aquabacter sp. L1I39 TaxID=2820278 RepID=UPI001ADC4F0F|nr:serine protease [Aquabacter sp. L1I39]QTL03129.1 trypsin-like peptidase domain-containing protein [Aquabacter sp. L1I39]
MTPPLRGRPSGPEAGFRERLQHPAWPPYVAAVMNVDASEPGGHGSGILVGEQHVLTCLHVILFGQGVGDRLSLSEALPSFRATFGDLPVSVHLFGAGERPRRATCVAEDRHLDLALLKLDEPVFGVAPPLEAVEPLAGMQWAFFCGFERAPDLRFAYTLRQIDPMLGTLAVGTRRTGDHAFGVPAGYSGGAVFCEREGQPVFVGLADMGGIATAAGHYAAADAVRRFLREKLGHHWADTLPVTAGARRARIAGLLSRVAGGVDVAPEFHLLPGEGVFLAVHPLTAASADQALGRSVRPGGDRLVAHVPDPEALGRLLHFARQRTGLPIRLPSLAAFGALCASGPPVRIVGRPPVLGDLWHADGLRAPPEVCAVWVEADGAPCVAVFEGGRVIRHGSAGGALAGMPHRRIAFLPAFAPQDGSHR